MMGTWHTEALGGMDVCLHTLVGRRPEQAEGFAARYGYRKWTTDLSIALADDQIDVVILANPSEQHAETALASLAHGKHTLVEIPLAMNLPDAERVVALARQRNLRLGVVHPMRARSEMNELRSRVIGGQEQIRHVAGRFFIHRLENIGATGYRRSWTDNLLWHHTSHILDFALWMVQAPIENCYSFMSPIDPRTGTPMDVAICLETERDQSIVLTGSYYGRERIWDTLVITDQDSYRLDVFGPTLTTRSGPKPIAREDLNCGLITRDFVCAVKGSRPPMVTGESVLPSLRILQQIQNRWDEKHGTRTIPGRQMA